MRVYRYLALLVVIAVFSQSAAAQRSMVLGDAPSPRILGAPLYPGSVFIRNIKDMSEKYDTAMYISLSPFERIEDFFSRHLAEKRMVTYEDSETFLSAFLLKTWSDIPDSLEKDDLDSLYREPSVQIQVYDPKINEMLAQYYDSNEGGRLTANALRRARTVILYTYERTAAPTFADRAIGTWIESSRDLPQYFGSRLTLNEDGTYTFQATPENLAALAAAPPDDADYCTLNESECTSLLSKRNPETGIYSISGNSISLMTDEAIDGDSRKGGLIDVGTVTMTLELIDKPRLTFVRLPSRERWPGTEQRRITPRTEPPEQHQGR